MERCSQNPASMPVMGRQRVNTRMKAQAAGALLAICGLLVGCGKGDELPPLTKDEGDHVIVTLVTGVHNMGPELAKKYPKGAKWVLKLPRDYVHDASRLRRDGPDWIDRVTVDLHWPTLNAWKPYMPIIEKQVGNRQFPTTSPFVTSARTAYQIDVLLRSAPIGNRKNDPDTYRKKKCVEHSNAIFALMIAPHDDCAKIRAIDGLYFRTDDKVFPDRFDVPETRWWAQGVLMRGNGEIDGWHLTFGVPVTTIHEVHITYDATIDFLNKHTVYRDSMKEKP
jgi:hypothetical protein